MTHVAYGATHHHWYSFLPAHAVSIPSPADSGLFLNQSQPDDSSSRGRSPHLVDGERHPRSRDYGELLERDGYEWCIRVARYASA